MTEATDPEVVVVEVVDVDVVVVEVELSCLSQNSRPTDICVSPSVRFAPEFWYEQYRGHGLIALIVPSPGLYQILLSCEF